MVIKSENNNENTAGSDRHERLVLPLWAEYGEGLPKRGDYNIRIRSKDGREKEIAAWHNPGNGHWLVGSKECGYVDIIQPPGESDEWRITHWQNVKHMHPHPKNSMKTNENLPPEPEVEAQEPASAGCHGASCCAS